MKQFTLGNILLILCCAFYLAWWLIAFRPEGAVRGMKSGWLLLPAAVCGFAAVILICGGVSATAKESMLVPAMWIAVAGVILYVVLLAGTWLIMKRPVTTELFLIVGWAVLAACETSALYGRGVFERRASLAWILCIVIMAVISLVCYLFYYHLDSVQGYYDGMIPLIIVAAVMAVMTAMIVIMPPSG